MFYSFLSTAIYRTIIFYFILFYYILFLYTIIGKCNVLQNKLVLIIIYVIYAFSFKS